MKIINFRYNIIIYSIVCLLNIIGFFILLNRFIFNSIYPNECVFHFSHRPRGILGDLFFPILSGSNDHPGPGIFNFLFVITTGIISGIVMTRIVKKMARKKIKEKS